MHVQNLLCKRAFTGNGDAFIRVGRNTQNKQSHKPNMTSNQIQVTFVYMPKRRLNTFLVNNLEDSII